MSGDDFNQRINEAIKLKREKPDTSYNYIKKTFRIKPATMKK